jgi:hypothetical protein
VPRRGLDSAVTDFRSIFDAIVADARYQTNLDWGKARAGHPEGTIRAHIAELESNLDVLRPKLSDTECWKLKILVHTHDTFKPNASRGVPIVHSESHASLAASFLAEYCQDNELLAIAQYHDEPYALWRQFRFKGICDQERWASLLGRVRDWDLFLAFLIVDGCTEGKSREPLRWFFDEVEGTVKSRFAVADIQ